MTDEKGRYEEELEDKKYLLGNISSSFLAEVFEHPVVLLVNRLDLGQLVRVVHQVVKLWAIGVRRKKVVFAFDDSVNGNRLPR